MVVDLSPRFSPPTPLSRRIRWLRRGLAGVLLVVLVVGLARVLPRHGVVGLIDFLVAAFFGLLLTGLLLGLGWSAVRAARRRWHRWRHRQTAEKPAFVIVDASADPPQTVAGKVGLVVVGAFAYTYIAGVIAGAVVLAGLVLAGLALPIVHTLVANLR
jgi:hypothetical protein